MRYLTTLCLTVLLLAAGPASARALAGVELPQQVVLQADGSRLVLNGAGVVRYLFTDVVVGALYLPQRQRDAVDVLNLPGPARVQIHVLYSALTVEDLEQAWLDCLQGSAEAHRLLPALRDLLALVPDLRRGDVLALDLYPGG